MIESIKIRKIRGIVFLIILMGLMFFMNTMVSGQVVSGDVLDKPICFKISPSCVDSSEFMEDLYSSDIKIDLYHIGDIRYISELNSYELCNIAEDVYGGVSKLNHVNIEKMNYTGSEWKTLSQEAIRKVFEEPVKSPVREVELGTEIRDINPGLYLMAVRCNKSQERSSYMKLSSEGEILTYVRSENYEYTFEPDLIVIPLWSIQMESQENTKDNDYTFTEYLEYGNSQEVYEIYIKTLREYKENTIDGSAGDSSDVSEEDSGKKYSYGSGGSGDSYKSSGSGDSYKSGGSGDSYRSGSNSTSIVKTGDDHNIFLYLILALIFGFGCIIFLVFTIKDNKRG